MEEPHHDGLHQSALSMVLNRAWPCLEKPEIIRRGDDIDAATVALTPRPLLMLVSRRGKLRQLVLCICEKEGVVLRRRHFVKLIQEQHLPKTQSP
ncbi:hypothetical protein SKAU_G00251170 [Synaphobranchus kaupii]|uniref:Uncharacterized protein n=1 Tax=Synaphobranchus kaupii TaxID=118154 RepID=A0A9Q1IRX2_SYNKA|nr:hypothetical protein SKAU_G00251170 [Synaphobranchus kaupii]